jgi:phage-related tail fiber protein
MELFDLYPYPVHGSEHMPNGIDPLPLVTQTEHGLMDKADKTKLDGIETGANKYIHPTSGIVAGTYRSVTLNTQGHVTGGTNPTTLAGYGITDATPSSHVGSTGTAHGIATTSVNGFMSSTDKTKLNSITVADLVTKSLTTTVTLLASNWTADAGDPKKFNYVLSVSNVTATNVVEITMASTVTSEQVDAIARAMIMTGSQSTDSITLSAFGVKPIIDVPITIIIRRDL